MTHAATELTEFDGSPIELFLFQRGAAVFWGYTSSTTTLNIQGQIYRACAMSRSSFEQSQDYKRNNIKITLPLNVDFIQQYISSPPTDKIDLTVYRYHEKDPDKQIVIRWTGRVVNVKFSETTAEILCESMETIFNRNTLKRPYGRGCPYYLYDPSGCKADPNAYAVGAALTAVNGVLLTSPTFAAYPSGHFNGGYLIFQVGSVLNKRFIISHGGPNIQINLVFSGLVPGVGVTVYPGCDRTPQTCSSKFNNILNYGGQPFIPTKNPMNGTPIF